jgi:hypothetical protein
MNTELKVRNLISYTYQVVMFYLDGDGERDDEETLYQGSLSDCEAYIRLKESDLLV